MDNLLDAYSAAVDDEEELEDQSSRDVERGREEFVGGEGRRSRVDARESDDDSRSLSDMDESSVHSALIELSTATGTPIATGISTPIATGIGTPIATGISTPIATSIGTPIATGISTPTAVGTPGTAAGTPGTAAGTPGTAAGTPGTAAGTPVIAAGTPGTAAGTPGTAAGTPVTAVGTPVTAVGTPVTAAAAVSSKGDDDNGVRARYGGDDEMMMLDDELKDSDDDDSTARSTSSTITTALAPTLNKPSLAMKRTITATRLVSYGADDLDDDDVDDSDNEGGASGEEGGGVLGLAGVVEVDTMTNKQLNESLSSIRHSISEDEVQLPPEPPGKCSIKLQDKVAKLYARVVRSGIDLNASIQRRKDFRNPSIYDKLVDFCQIDEKGTNYPPELYNPSIWGPESNYEYLAKQQKAEMDRKEKERKEKQMKDKGYTQVERIVATKKPASSSSAAAGAASSGLSPEARKRSKWDSVGGAQIPATGPISSKSKV